MSTEDLIKSCEHCGSNLNNTNSVVRAFYKKDSNEEVFLKGHYLKDGEGEVPDGTFNIDEDIDYDIDSEIHDASDTCVICNGENE